jgi:hypothetical protein
MRAGLITQNQLLDALAARRRQGGTLAEHLVRAGAVTDDRLADFYRDRLLVPLVSRPDLAAARPPVLARIPAKMAEEFRVVPVSLDRDGNLLIAMVDPSDTHVADEVGFFASSSVVRAVATYGDLSWALEHHYQVKLPQAPRRADPSKDTDRVRPPLPASPDRPLLLTKPKPKILPEEPVIVLDKVKAPPPAEVIADVTDRYQRVPASVVVDLGHEAGSALKGTLSELEAARTEADVSAALLRFIAGHCRRAVFFRVKRGTLAGQGGLGTGVVTERLQRARLALDRPSVFQSLVQTRLPYRGPVSDATSRDFLIQALGWAPTSALAVPLTVHGHVVGVVYGDEQRSPLPDDELGEVTRRAQSCLERLQPPAPR